MSRRGALTLVCSALVAILLVSVASADQVPLAERGPTISWEIRPRNPNEIELSRFEIADQEQAPTTPGQARLPGFVSTVLQLLLIAGVIALLIVAWSRRPRLSWRRPRPSDDFDVLDDVATLVAADASEQRQLLHTGEPRNAIVACWLRLEALVAAAGHHRHPADTSAEFTARVLATFAVDAAAVDRLASLYREARFSSHDMGEDQRRAAIASLDALHDSMRRLGGAPASGPAGSVTHAAS